MSNWPDRALTSLLLLMLATVVTAGCSLPRQAAGPTTGPAGALAPSPLKISPPTPSPTSPQMAGKSAIIWQAVGSGSEDEQFTFLARRDEAPETIIQTGSSPFSLWRPQEPGQYQVRVTVRTSDGRSGESDWSEPFQIVLPRIAVLPFVNLSTVAAPLAEMRQALQELLRKQGVDLLEEKELLAFMGRHRLRSTASLPPETARAFLAETGVTGVLITQLTLFQEEEFPPKFALTSRLVTTGESSGVGWTESISLSGDDQRGLLDLGLISDIDRLRDKGLARLAAGLNNHLDGRESGGDRTFRPRSFYRSPTLEADRPFTVAILPFVNQTQRRFAGELMGLLFLHHLSQEKNFRLLEPGLLEEQLLRYRIIVPEGASLDTANILFSFLEVDLLLSGKILAYEDSAGEDGSPRVQFSVQAIHRQDEELVWSSISSNEGSEGVLFFDLGRIKSAHELASRMTRETVRQMVRP